MSEVVRGACRLRQPAQSARRSQGLGAARGPLARCCPPCSQTRAPLPRCPPPQLTGVDEEKLHPGAGSKLLITLGPSCQDVDTLVRMLEAGVTCARIDLTVRRRAGPGAAPDTPLSSRACQTCTADGTCNGALKALSPPALLCLPGPGFQVCRCQRPLGTQPSSPSAVST